MREIKFRAWLKEESKMADWARLRKACDFLIFEHPNLAEVMQFTGLKDKNGKEIYEGDIYRSTNSDWFYVISFVNGYFGGCHPNQSPNEALMVSDEDGNFEELYWLEVIGNIYENPDLLD